MHGGTLKGQSAIEFLTTYGFVFIVIALVLTFLIIFATIPKATFPTECTFYSEFHCLDSIYFGAPGGSQLVVLSTDMVPGNMSISGFNAIMGSYPSTGGFCTPNTITAGQMFYCAANFSEPVTPGQQYSGMFSVVANYCAGAPSRISNSTCPKETYYFGGQLRTDGSVEHPIFVTFIVKDLQFVRNGAALRVNGSNFEDYQLPLVEFFQYGSTHVAEYSPVIRNSGMTAFIFNSISGCGLSTEGGIITATKSCTVTATYNSITYQQCTSFPTSGGSNLNRISASYCYVPGYDMKGDNVNYGNLNYAYLESANLNNTNFDHATLMFTDLQNVYAYNINFENANLVGADLQGITATQGTNFNYADMEYADLQGGNFSGDNFEGTNLEFANLGNANLTNVNFQNANLQYANLVGANINGAKFKGANMNGCTGCP